MYNASRQMVITRAILGSITERIQEILKVGSIFALFPLSPPYANVEGRFILARGGLD